MGSVQKLATVVMIGLVALATVTLIYVANEPNRRDSEIASQDDLAIERGTQLYITYCLQCHAPGGEGAAEKGGAGTTGRVGGILNQSIFSDTSALPIVFQSDDPSMQSKAEAYIRYRIANGVPGDPRATTILMPAFGPELNVEETNDLVYLLMHGDWNYVYNQAVLTTGQHVQAQDCAATPTADICGESAPAVYPTVPPTAVPTAEEGASPAAATPAASDSAAPSGSSQTIELDAQDISWSQKEITAKPGDTIVVKNVGALPHDFSVDALNISDPVDSGASVTVTIPADAKPGSYEFYCNVAGHKEAGMVGTLTIAP